MSVQSQIDRLNVIKQRIRTNLVAQGITVPDDTKLEAMAEQILSVAGEDGQRGTGLLSVTTAPSSYTTAVGGITPKYRMVISTIKTQAGVTEVLLGDTIRYSYYQYPIDYLDASYAYCTTRISLRGATGSAGNTSVKVMTKTEYSALTAESVMQLYTSGIRLIIVEDESVNLVPSAISADGGIYNGCGYMNGIRLNSSGEIVTSRQSCVTGFIPFTYGQKLSVYGSKGPLGTPGQYVAAYNDAFVRLGVTYMESLSGVTATADEDNIYTFTANTTQTMFNGASYIRISLNPCEGRDIVVQLGGDAE